MPKKKAEPKYYSLDEILKLQAVYNMIYGSRSFGKSFALTMLGAENYVRAANDGKREQMAYLRRYDEDLKTVNAGTFCDCLICDGEGKNRVIDLTGGDFDSVIYYQRGWYFCKTRNGKRLKDNYPFMVGFSFPAYEHFKNADYPFVNEIWFDEFIGVSGKAVPKDEFVVFQNVISTIARGRHVRIWMTGNTINPFSPYFEWMGLTNAAKQKPGTIDVYKLGKTDKKIAVERTIERKEYVASKKSNSYLFAFDDPKLQMITTGGWEIGVFPLFDGEIKTEDIAGRFFIKHKDKIFQADIVSNQSDNFIYIHKDIDFFYPIDEDYDLIYSLETSSKSNYRQRMDKALTEPERWIATLFSLGKVYYDENWTGVAVQDYRTQMIK